MSMYVHPKCMDHAILHGKPFGNCVYKINTVNLNFPCRIVRSCMGVPIEY